jgi:uncharacterized Zn finger protein
MAGRDSPVKESSPFAVLLERDTLRRLAGARSFDRGEGYFLNGQVKALAENEGTITAKVQGTRPYRVELWIEEDDLEYSCTCPIGADGEFCKHCVAVGLSWTENIEQKNSKKGKRASGVTIEDVRTYLQGQDKNALVEMLVNRSLKDDRLRQSLFIKAAKRSSKGLDLTTYRRAIHDAVEPDGFVDYRSAYDYAHGIEETIDSVEELLKEGHPAEVIDLAEHALKAVEKAMGSVDDSDGYMGDLLARLQDLHHKACKKAKPDPEALARRLFEWELRTDYDTFYGVAETYASILGSKGLAVYRMLAEEEWAKVPALRPGQDDSEKYGKRFRVTHIMETLARQTGDVEAVVAVKKRDLSLAYHYLQIAETYKSAGKHDLAMEWAERGVKAFPERTDSRLREFLAGEYHRRKRHDEAMALIWAEFTESPSLERYRNLKAHAERISHWKSWREKALEYLREQIARAKDPHQGKRWPWHHKADHSDLVRIFLWEKDVEVAWREAQAGGCSNDLWLELAARRDNEHPEDALPIYQRQIEPTLDRKNNEAYAETISLLRKVRELMVKLERKDEFTNYLAGVRAAHKPKRNFMKLLDRASL